VHTGPSQGGPAIAFGLQDSGYPHDAAALVAGQDLVGPRGVDVRSDDGDQVV